jgi:hypothetical protein
MTKVEKLQLKKYFLRKRYNYEYKMTSTWIESYREPKVYQVYLNQCFVYSEMGGSKSKDEVFKELVLFEKLHNSSNLIKNKQLYSKFKCI